MFSKNPPPKIKGLSSHFFNLIKSLLGATDQQILSVKTSEYTPSLTQPDKIQFFSCSDFDNVIIIFFLFCRLCLPPLFIHKFIINLNLSINLAIHKSKFNLEILFEKPNSVSENEIVLIPIRLLWMLEIFSLKIKTAKHLLSIIAF